MRRVWEGKSGGRGGSEAGSRGEKLVYQQGLIMETHRKPLRRIFHDVAQEPWHTQTHRHTHFESLHTHPQHLCSNPTQAGPPTPTRVSCDTAAKKVRRLRPSQSANFSLSLIPLFLNASYWSPPSPYRRLLAAPALAGASCQLLVPGPRHWLATFCRMSVNT